VFQLKLMGSPRVGRDGHDTPLALKRGAALLAVLALSPAAVPRAHLTNLLWPDASDATARTRLRRLIYTIEQSLGSELFEVAGDALSLRGDAVQVDVREIVRSARGALAGESRGDAATMQRWVDAAASPLLHGLEFGSDTFDAWLREQRLELERLLARWFAQRGAALQRDGDIEAAIDAVERWLRLDPLSEPAHVRLMELHAALGHAAGVEAAFTRCADALRAEFGSKPGAATEQAYLALRQGLQGQAATAELSALQVRYADTLDGAVAYAMIGDASQTLVIIPGFISHIEIGWEQPEIRRMLLALARRFRIVVFDRRGAGLSERLFRNANAQSAAQDVLTILDHAGIERAWLFGSSEGGPIALHLAAAHPDRVAALVLFGAMARGSWSATHPWALRPEAYDVWVERLLAAWGGPADLATFASSRQNDPAMRLWWARMLRHAASPASVRATLEGLRDVDVCELLPRVRAPTLVLHRRDDCAVRSEWGHYLAGAIAGASHVPLDGADHFWWCGDTERVLAEIDRFADRVGAA